MVAAVDKRQILAVMLIIFRLKIINLYYQGNMCEIFVLHFHHDIPGWQGCIKRKSQKENNR